jgi:hypothetical protein
VRLGRFYVDKRLVDDRNILPILQMLELVPTRVQSAYEGYMYEFEGTSPHFSEIEEGAEVPLYEVLEYNGKLIVKPKEEGK